MMEGPTTTGVTQLLMDWRAGDAGALDRLTPMVYGELRRLARYYMNDERSKDVLQTTALVHEAYLRLVGLDVSWKGRGHFFSIASQLMRHILVDFARQRRAEKRGSGQTPLSLEEVSIPIEAEADLVDLDEALKALAAFDPRKSQVVELRFFGGLTIDETADFLEVSHATIERDLKVAKAWLARYLTQSSKDS